MGTEIHAYLKLQSDRQGRLRLLPRQARRAPVVPLVRLDRGEPMLTRLILRARRAQEDRAPHLTEILWVRPDPMVRLLVMALLDPVPQQALWDRRGHQALPHPATARHLEVLQVPQLTRPDRLPQRGRRDPLDRQDRVAR